MARKNFAYSTVATAPSPATSGTSLVVAAAGGAKFPSVPFNAIIWPTAAQPTSANAEIVRVTAISTDTFTITRTQESTSARTVIVGDQIAAVLTVRAMEESLAAIATGDGSDGAVTLDGTTTYAGFTTTSGGAPNLVYTLTRDVYATDLTVSSGKILNTGGYRIHAMGTLTNAGTIRNNGGAASGTTAGTAAPGGSVAGGGAGAAGLASGTSSSVGTGATATNAGYHSLGGLGGTGGGNVSQTGGAGGALSTIARTPGFRDFASAAALSWTPPATAATSAPGSKVVVGGGTGGGSGGRTTSGTATASGAGGGGGGVVWIACRALDNTGGVISANGGDGSAATGGTTKVGGGAGGGGGVVFLLYGHLLALGTATATGGGLGAGLNSPSVAAQVGADGRVIQLAMA